MTQPDRITIDRRNAVEEALQILLTIDEGMKPEKASALAAQAQAWAAVARAFDHDAWAASRSEVRKLANGIESSGPIGQWEDR